MPGWQLPDQQTWQLVSYIRNLPLTVSVDGQAAAAHYAGSTSCKSCHNDLYERWRKTPMAAARRFGPCQAKEGIGRNAGGVSGLHAMIRGSAR